MFSGRGGEHVVVPEVALAPGRTFLLHALAAFAAPSLAVEAVVAAGYPRWSESLFRVLAATTMYGASLFIEKPKLAEGA